MLAFALLYKFMCLSSLGAQDGNQPVVVFRLFTELTKPPGLQFPLFVPEETIRSFCAFLFLPRSVPWSVACGRACRLLLVLSFVTVQLGT